MRHLNCKSTSSRWIQRLPLTNQLNLSVLDNPWKIQNDGNHPTAENNKLYTCGSLHKQYKIKSCVIKFLSAKFIKCKHCDPNLSLPAQAKFHCFLFLHVCQVSPHSHVINISSVTQWSLLTRFLLLLECILCEHKFF